MKQRLQWLVPVLWLLAACSHVQDEEQGVSRQALASDASSCQAVTLAARRDWQPSRKVNGEIELRPARTLVLPSVVSVTAGNAGNKKVKLEIETAAGSKVKCTYRGGAASPHPTTPADVAAGLAYEWESCGGGLVPGTLFSAKELELEVQGGDSQLPSTAVSMVFAVPGCAADAGGEAGTDASAGFDAGREGGVDAGLEGGAGDSGSDSGAGPADAGFVDAGHDAGAAVDAGLEGGASDSGVVDAGAVDAGPSCTAASCSDGNACNGIEVCNANGTCSPGTPPVVDDGNVCTVDSCNAATGVTHTPAPVGVSCTDVNVCNGDETCNSAGACAAGAPPVLDDGNDCTADSCSAQTGVMHVPVTAGTSCADGNVCNGAETCNGAGVCSSGAPLVVNDGNPCTVDACDAVLGVSHAPAVAGSSCSDENACNGDEACDGAGACSAGVPPVVDDGNPCTADACNPVRGVEHTHVAAGTSCSDSDACNGTETCDGAGACSAGTPPVLDDGNLCTVDTCSAAQGVIHTPLALGTGCGDGDACNGAETCNAIGTCTSGAPPAVDDGNVCTVDACDAVSGVSHTVDRTKPGCEGDPLVDAVFEPAASVFGRVVDANGTPIPNYTIEAFDYPATGPARSDVVFSHAVDGSFRFRITSIPNTVVEGVAPAHVVLRFTSGTALPAVREVYLHSGEVAELGLISLIQRDPLVTVIGPAGGIARDSSGEFEVEIPAGAIDHDIPVQITPFRKREHFTVPLPDVTLTMYGFDLSPDGTSFAQPVTVRFANTKNLPTNLKIPMGTGHLETGRWEHEGFATWNGTRWSTEIRHFSPHDGNGAWINLLSVQMSGGKDPDKALKKDCGGSTVGRANGVLDLDVPLPEFQRRDVVRGGGLHYSSAMAGTFAPRAPGPEVTTRGVYPGTVGLRAVASPSVSLSCVPAMPMEVLRGASVFACGSGTGSLCSRAGGSVAFAGAFSTQVTGGGTESPEGLDAVGAQDANPESFFQIPTDGSNSASSPSYFAQHLRVSLGGTSSCASSGAFSVRDFAAQFGTVPIAPPPIQLTRPVFLPHAMNSPFGRGWGFEGVSRIYRDPRGSEYALVDGAHAPEYFRARATLRAVRSRIGEEASFARDPQTGDVFAVTKGASNRLMRVSESAPWSEVSLNPVGEPMVALSIGYVGSTRHFLVAGRSRKLYDMIEGGAVRTLFVPPVGTREGGDIRDNPDVAAHGAQVLYVTGLSNELNAKLLSFDIGQPTPIALNLVSGSASGNPSITLHGEALGSLAFAQPRGLAFAPDGTLFLGDRNRNVVFRVRAAASGQIAASSSVDRILGDGAGAYIPIPGLKVPGEHYPLAQPSKLAVASDGAVWTTVNHGLVRWDSRTQEGELVAADVGAGRDATLGVSMFSTPGLSNDFLPLDGRRFLFSWSPGVYLAESVLASELEPTRTLQVATNGETIVTDTAADRIESFDALGRIQRRENRSGDLIEAFEYASPTSARPTRIVTSAGDATVFESVGGRITAVVDPAGRRTQLSFDGAGNLARIVLPEGDTHTFSYVDYKMTRRVDPRGDATEYTFGSDGVLRGSRKPTGETYTFRPALTEPVVRDATGVSVRKGFFTDPRGVEHSYTVDRNGAVTQEDYVADGRSYGLKTVFAPQLTDLWRFSAEMEVNTELPVANFMSRVSHVELNSLPVGRRYYYDSLGRVRRIDTSADTAVPGVSGPTMTPLVFVDYRADGRVDRVNYGANAWMRSVYNADGRLVRSDRESSAGAILHTHAGYTYQPNGLLATMTQNGLQAAFSYDSRGLVREAVDSLGRIQQWTRDEAGHVLAMTDGVASSQATYDRNGRMTSRTDAFGNTTTMEYTNVGCGCSEGDRLTSLHTPDLAPNAHWSFAYAPGGRLSSVTDPNNKTETRTYAPTGEVTRYVDRLLRETTFASFDALGRMRAGTDAAGRTFSLSHPEPTATGLLGGQVLSLSGVGSTVGDVSSIVPEGEIQVGVGTFSRSPTQFRALGVPQTTVYRDATMQIVYHHEYGALANLQRFGDSPGRSPTATEAWNDASDGVNISHQAAFDPSFARFVQSHATTSRVGSAFLSNSFTRDGDFNLTQRESNGLRESFVREAGGRMLRQRREGFWVNPVTSSVRLVRFLDFNANQNGTGADSEYVYSSNGYLTQVKDGDGVHSFTYTPRGQLASLEVLEGRYVFGYDEVGRNTQLTYPDGHTRTQVFDALGRITSRCYAYAASSRCYTATYDAVGNPVVVSDPEGSEALTVDALDRLTRVDHVAAGSGASSTMSYTYNTVGALRQRGDLVLSDKRPRLAGGGSADAIVPSSVPDPETGALLPIALGPSGLVTGVGGHTLGFNRFGLPEVMTRPSGASTEQLKIRYGADWLRVSEQHLVGAAEVMTLFAHEAGNRVAEFTVAAGAGANPTITPVRTWLYDGVDHPLRMRDWQSGAPSSVVYYELDLSGNVRRLRAPGGGDLGGYRYEAFGKMLPADAATPAPVVEQPLRWKGRPWSPFGGPSGTYDMRARVWSPNTGTFLSIDALGYHDPRGTLFSWPAQNPVRFSDPSGHMGDPVSDLVERAGEVSGVFTAGTAAANGLVGGGVATAGISAGWLVLPAAIAAGAGLVIWNDWYNFKHPTIASGGAGGGSCRTDRQPQASFPGVPPAAGGGGGGADAGAGRGYYPSASQLAKRLGVSQEEFHKEIKQGIVRDLQAEARAIGARNPDIGVNDQGNITLKNPVTGAEIQTDVPLSSYGP